jgi:hypothetical protein
MGLREVQKIKAEYLRPLNQGLISAGSATPFESFVDTVYKTTSLPLMASSTQVRYRGIIDLYLIPTFGSLCLRDMTPLTLQKYISGFQIKEPDDTKQKNPERQGKDGRLARESVDKIRDVAFERPRIGGEVRVPRHEPGPGAPTSASEARCAEGINHL